MFTLFSVGGGGSAGDSTGFRLVGAVSRDLYRMCLLKVLVLGWKGGANFCLIIKGGVAVVGWEHW